MGSLAVIGMPNSETAGVNTFNRYKKSNVIGLFSFCLVRGMCRALYIYPIDMKPTLSFFIELSTAIILLGSFILLVPIISFGR